MVDIYLRVVHIGGGAMRLPPLSPASGRRLRHGEVVVSMHQVCQVMADSLRSHLFLIALATLRPSRWVCFRSGSGRRSF